MYAHDYEASSSEVVFRGAPPRSFPGAISRQLGVPAYVAQLAQKYHDRPGLSSRNLLLLMGTMLLVVIVAVPLWDVTRLLDDRNFVYFLGSTLPTLVVATCAGAIFVYIITVLVFFALGRDEFKTEQTFLMIAACIATMLGLALLLLSEPLSTGVQAAYSEIFFSCETGMRTKPLHDTAETLGQLRLLPECRQLASVELCQGFTPSPEAEFLKALESNYKCSGFCAADASTLVTTAAAATTVELPHAADQIKGTAGNSTTVVSAASSGAASSGAASSSGTASSGASARGAPRSLPAAGNQLPANRSPQSKPVAEAPVDVAAAAPAVGASASGAESGVASSPASNAAPPSAPPEAAPVTAPETDAGQAEKVAPTTAAKTGGQAASDTAAATAAAGLSGPSGESTGEMPAEAVAETLAPAATEAEQEKEAAGPAPQTAAEAEAPAGARREAKTASLLARAPRARGLIAALHRLAEGQTLEGQQHAVSSLLEVASSKIVGAKPTVSTRRPGSVGSYPPTLFSKADYQATCSGMASRSLLYDASNVGSLLYAEGLALIFISVTLSLAKLGRMLMEGSSDSAHRSDAEKVTAYGAVL